ARELALLLPEPRHGAADATIGEHLERDTPRRVEPARCTREPLAARTPQVVRRDRAPAPEEAAHLALDQRERLRRPGEPLLRRRQRSESSGIRGHGRDRALGLAGPPRLGKTPRDACCGGACWRPRTGVTRRVRRRPAEAAQGARARRRAWARARTRPA